MGLSINAQYDYLFMAFSCAIFKIQHNLYSELLSYKNLIKILLVKGKFIILNYCIKYEVSRGIVLDLLDVKNK